MAESGGENPRPEEAEEGDDVITLGEVIAESDRLEQDAAAVLGPCSHSDCSYEKGYVSRQALYSCTTCRPEGDAGVCLGCSLRCHQGHHLVELYTKRSFRCDCGNSKFPASFKCQLYSNKANLNERNKYNHNYRGLYCTCERPYPDAEEDVEDEMVQCVVCEDWFHTRHLAADGERLDIDFAEVVCEECVGRLPFLFDYNCSDEGRTSPDGSGAVAEGETEIEKQCKWKKIEGESKPRSLFWATDWRLRLCRCSSCLAMYQEKECDFFVEAGDSVAEYEQQTSQETDSLRAGMEALEQIPRSEQMEMLHEYNDLKEQLSDYLRGFAETGKVVSEQDVREFFDGLQKAKRPRLLPPESCR